jgi:phosphatidylserine/phosphatidylglycerophosphate/cardiolipin synthase-like enzyme/regulation of enolase protein 1 (concanavalin A-like superfamily)
MSDRLDASNLVRRLRLRLTRRVAVALAIVPLMVALAAPAHAACPAATDSVFFSSNTNVTDILVQCINNETVRLDISSWYLSEHSISIAIANRFAAGVKVRIIGDRGAIFEADPNTKAQYYFLANLGIPIRLRFNPNWFPEIDHWKAAIFVGQGVVEFGSGNFAPTELAPNSPTDYDDDSEMFTRDPQIVAAFKMKFDRMWNDTTVEPQSIIAAPPYLKDWYDACDNEPKGCDFRTQFPNAASMTINTARLEPDVAIPADLIFGQGSEFNNRLTQEINNENTKIDIIVYRLEVDNITQALIDKHNAGVPVRVIVDKGQYTNPIYPEYWLTHANIERLLIAGIPILQNNHAGVTHMKTLITSNYATNGSSNFGPNWQRDHNYFVSALGKPTVYQAFNNEFQAMWTKTTDFIPLVTTPPSQANIVTPAPGGSAVPITTSLVWNRAAYAVSYDVYLGTSSGGMSLVANVPAQLVVNPPDSYSWTPPTPLQANTTYLWKIVSRTFANMTASTSNQSFTTGAGSGGGTVPSPWLHQDIGSVGISGSASSSGGAFTVAGAGSDIWGASDSFHFVYQSLGGDGQIIARVTAMQNTSANAKAGIMFRSSLASTAANVILDVTPSGNIEFMARASDGGSTAWFAGATDPAPVWLKLVRSGSTVTGSISADGLAWTAVGSTSAALGSGASVGLAVTSHNTSQLNTSTFDSVAVTASSGGTAPGTPATPSPANGGTGVSTSQTLTWSSTGATSYDVKFGTANPPPQVTTGQASGSYTPSTTAAGTQYFWQIVAHNSVGTTTGPVWSYTTAAAAGLPSPWLNQDVGSVGIAGSTSFGGGVFTVKGAGGDIWGAADAFQFAYQAFSGDGQIVARVASMQNTNSNAKAGLMFRGNLTAGSAHVMIDVEPNGNIEFMTRSTSGGQTSWLAGATRAAPVWLKLVRSGSTVTGFMSTDGSTWTTVGSTTISLPASADVGLIVTSHDTSQLNTSTFDQAAVGATGGGTAPGTPSSPGPANGGTGVVTNPTLTWSSSGGTSYDVNFGTANPPPQVSTGQPSASYSPGTLQNSRQYFWQIVAHNSIGATTGPVWSFTTGASSTPANIVIYASDIPAANRHGSWTIAGDSTAAAGNKLITPDSGVANTAGALAAPTDYVDVTFAANAGTPYTIWLRLQALNNSKFNDSIFVQFSDAQSGGSGIYGLNTTSGLLVNLANDSTGASLQGWGWVNSAYWLSQPTTLTFAGSGNHTLRIQVREDGVQFDQIVLSPTTYLNTPPGPASNDATIVPKP